MKIKLSFVIFLYLCLGFIGLEVYAQENIVVNDSIAHQTIFQKIPYKQIVVPAALMTYGIISLNSPYLKHKNEQINDGINNDPSKTFKIDNVTLFIPSAAVYGLDLIGVKSKHNFKERLFVSAVSHAITLSTVYAIKHTTPTWRPDLADQESFPSGHTAVAFTGAEMLWQEYKDQSIWYGIAGYTIAAGTGYLRMYNHKHWFSDVAMGAGIGMMGTKIAYWLLPLVDKHLQSNTSTSLTMVAPFYNGKQAGLVTSFQF
ncbi:phosphatase PAP2 family protein [Sphingobacterium sp. SRCM116780]|uniref:phosphatase PAP2 family protein n=1 Tax=Sphingobacterium sp. SRCM116780 TaxID=2907623 RepID=UPI001F3F94FD|nr:phosphatase PAP2 family protein [Sphingobacterium sp. SRCM116780]UIR55487.1 phosphatase PAP2 family protein [Sphingobacterium sp. SRCM116780]